jgi:hypothetical protein
MLLLQSGELGLEFALIFVGHDARYMKNAMRLRMAVESLWRNIGSAAPVSKPAKCAGRRGGRPNR